VRPWEEARGEVDLEAQRTCYQALVSALERETWIAGVFWWNWPSGSEGGSEGGGEGGSEGGGQGAGKSGGARDGSHTPRGKPAEQVMQQALTAWQGRPVNVPRSPADRRAPAPP
jgi:hypothetical protein